MVLDFFLTCIVLGITVLVMYLIVLYTPINLELQIGGSGVLVSKLTYIFDEETPRWRKLLSELGL